MGKKLTISKADCKMQQYKKRKHVITTATFHVDLGNILEKFEL